MIPRLRDYEPEGPWARIRFSSPEPPFWRLKRFSRIRAFLRLRGVLENSKLQGPRPRVHLETPWLC